MLRPVLLVVALVASALALVVPVMPAVALADPVVEPAPPVTSTPAPPTSTTTTTTAAPAPSTSATATTTTTVTPPATTVPPAPTLPTLPQLCAVTTLPAVDALLDEVPVTALTGDLAALVSLTVPGVVTVQLRAGVDLAAVRDVLDCDPPTTTTTPAPTPTAAPVDVDCEHLTQAEAQAILDADVAGDPHGLDGDADGVACDDGLRGGAQVRAWPLGAVAAGDGSTLR